MPPFSRLLVAPAFLWVQRTGTDDGLLRLYGNVDIREVQLAKLRRGLRPQEITQARESLKQAQAVGIDTERNHQRQSRLLASGASSQSTVDADRTVAISLVGVIQKRVLETHAAPQRGESFLRKAAEAFALYRAALAVPSK